MKGIIVKLIGAAICLVMLCASMTSCGIFFDEENNFVGFNNIIEFIFEEENVYGGNGGGSGFDDGFDVMS